MKIGRGWWALAGIVVGSVLLLLAGYVGAYYASVYPMRNGIDFVNAVGDDQLAYGEAMATYSTEPFDSLRINPDALFQPIHRIDRRIRPQVWNPPENPPENSN